MNTSDQNEIKSDISSEIESIDEIDVSLEIESIDGDDDLQFEVPHLSEDEIEENIPPSKAKRSKNHNIFLLNPLKTKKILTNFGRKTSMKNF